MIAFSSNWLVFFPVAFSLFVAMRLSQGAVDQGRGSWVLQVFRSLVAILFFFSLLAVGLRVNVLSLVWMVLLVAFAFVWFWKGRRLERSAVLLTAMSATTADQQQLMANYFATENTGWLRRRTRDISRDLAMGVAWGQALERRGIATGVYERLALRLRTSYGIGASDESRVNNGNWQSPLRIEAEAERLVGRLMLFFWTIIVLPFFIALIMIFIVPTFQQMFAEFGLRLPGPMQFMIDASDFSVSYGLAYLFAFLPFAMFAFGLGLFSVWLFPSLLQLPGLRWFCRDYHRNAGFNALARVLDREQDLVAAVHATAQVVPVAYIGQRYQATAALLKGGASPTQAFLNSGLLSDREVKAFAQGLDTRDPAWGLQQLASSRTERMLNRYSSVVQVLVVVITLCVAAIVGILAVGVISTLSVMIQSLS